MALFRANTSGGGSTKIKIGTFNPPASSSASPNYATVSCGFEPKYLFIMCQASGGQYSGKLFGDMYNADVATSNAWHGSEGGNTFIKYSLPSSNTFQIKRITSDGFEYNYTTQYFSDCWYIAIG